MGERPPRIRSQGQEIGDKGFPPNKCRGWGRLSQQTWVLQVRKFYFVERPVSSFFPSVYFLEVVSKFKNQAFCPEVEYSGRSAWSVFLSPLPFLGLCTKPNSPILRTFTVLRVCPKHMFTQPRTSCYSDWSVRVPTVGLVWALTFSCH